MVITGSVYDSPVDGIETCSAYLYKGDRIDLPVGIVKCSRMASYSNDVNRKLNQSQYLHIYSRYKHSYVESEALQRMSHAQHALICSLGLSKWVPWGRVLFAKFYTIIV